MELTGKIKLIGETKTFGTGNFAKRDLVVTTDEQYLIEFVQDKCDILNKYKVGDSVKVGINLRGREWINPEGVAKYFNSIQGWRIDKATDAPADYVAPQQAQPVAVEEEPDLPF